MKFTLELEMCSDWHVGSGFGRPGDVDSLVVRDADRLPYVPAKTLTGILRDACELAARGLDDGAPTGVWQKWVTWIFGSQPSVDKRLDRPVAAALAVGPARFPREMAERLLESSEDDQRYVAALRQALTFVKPGVTLEAENGMAAAGQLRTEEVVRGGVVLLAEGNLPIDTLDASRRRACLGLLAAGCSLADHIGGKRRRGNGKVTITLHCEGEAADVSKLLTDELAANLPEPPTRQLSRPTATRLTEVGTEPPKAGWQVYDLQLVLETPVVIRSAVKGNVVETLDYIPGTYLCGPVVRVLWSAGLTDPDTALQDGRLIVENATVEVDGQRGLPVPMAFFKKKVERPSDPPEARNRLVEALPPEDQYKGLRHGYVAWKGGGGKPVLYYKQVSLIAAMHNSVNDENQHPDESVGGVYTYMALAPGQTFHTVVHVASTIGNASSAIESLVRTTLRIGLSSKDDFGTVRVTAITSASDCTALQDKCEPQPNRNADSLRDLTVWLLSDVLLRDQFLQADTTPEGLKANLEEALKCTLAPVDQQNGRLWCIGQHHRIDSWQVSWGLPRPSLAGLAAGTCLVFAVSGVHDEQEFRNALARIEAEGIGERRAEGYGRLAFNTQLLSTSCVSLKDDEGDGGKDLLSLHLPAQSSSGPAASLPDVTEIERSLKRVVQTQEIRAAALRVASNDKTRREALGIENGKPTNSQLGVLRGISASVCKPGPENRALEWLRHEKTQKASMGDAPEIVEKWGKTAVDALWTLFTDRDKVWEILFEPGSWQATHLKPKNGGPDSDELWVEAIRTLLDQCLRFEKRGRER